MTWGIHCYIYMLMHTFTCMTCTVFKCMYIHKPENIGLLLIQTFSVRYEYHCIDPTFVNPAAVSRLEGSEGKSHKKSCEICTGSDEFQELEDDLNAHNNW